MPGLGAKTARRLYDELGIEDLEGLRAAAEQGRIRELRGLGPTAEENVLAALETMPDAGEDADRRLLSDVLPVAREIAEALRESSAAGRVEIAGSARRWAETCKDIDLVATAADPAALVEALGEHALVSEERAGGDGGAQVLTHAGLKLDLRIVPEENFGKPPPALHRLGRAQRAATRAGARPGSLGERARGRRDRGQEGPPLQRGGGGLRAARTSLHRAGAARGPRRDRGRRLGRAAGAGPPRGHPRRPPFPHDALGRPQLARGDGGGRPAPRLRLLRDHRPLRQPRVRRPRHPEAAGEADRRGAGLERVARRGGSASWRAPRSTSAPRGSSTTPTSCSRSSTGWSPASTPRSGSPSGR